MPQKKVLKLKPKTKIICKILAIIIIALAVFLGYYLPSRNELKKAGVTEKFFWNAYNAVRKAGNKATHSKNYNQLMEATVLYATPGIITDKINELYIGDDKK